MKDSEFLIQSKPCSRLIREQSCSLRLLRFGVHGNNVDDANCSWWHRVPARPDYPHDIGANVPGGRPGLAPPVPVGRAEPSPYLVVYDPRAVGGGGQPGKIIGRFASGYQNVQRLDSCVGRETIQPPDHASKFILRSRAR